MYFANIINDDFIVKSVKGMVFANTINNAVIVKSVKGLKFANIINENISVTFVIMLKCVMRYVMIKTLVNVEQKQIAIIAGIILLNNSYILRKYYLL